MESLDLSFYRGRKVLVTGHTGFKGAWLCKMLVQLGANVTGYALESPTVPNLFDMLKMNKHMVSHIGNVCDLNYLAKVFNECKPEIVFHLAAQPLVRESYINPVDTYQTNVMGTVNLLECVRNISCVKSVIIVTTDKVYQNNEWAWGYRETDRLNGHDPYSNSKSCTELITDSYNKVFLKDRHIAVSTLRAGNVIGGCDFAKDRIIPDCVRAVQTNDTIIIRNPNSIRPYQHVLEPLVVYLKLAALQYSNASFCGAYNIGPDDSDCVTTQQLVELFIKNWHCNYEIKQDLTSYHEANFLKLDSSKIKRALNWQPLWNIQTAVEKTVEGYRNLEAIEKQITEALI